MSQTKSKPGAAKGSAIGPDGLNQKQAKHLKGLAHHLKPVVQIGNKGLTDAVISQIDTQLEIHELVKVKIGQDAPVERDEVATAAAKACKGHAVQVIGRNVVLYRPRKKNPSIRLPRA